MDKDIVFAYKYRNGISMLKLMEAVNLTHGQLMRGISVLYKMDMDYNTIMNNKKFCQFCVIMGDRFIQHVSRPEIFTIVDMVPCPWDTSKKRPIPRSGERWQQEEIKWFNDKMEDFIGTMVADCTRTQSSVVYRIRTFMKDECFTIK